MPITIVGLGPGHPDQLTLEAREVLARAPVVYLRTARHPTVAGLPTSPRLESFDRLYEELPTFESVYSQIVETLLALAQDAHDVVYAVPGHPLVAETSVRRLLDRAREGGIPVRIVPGLSFLDPVFTALDLDPLDHGLQMVDAHQPDLDPGRPALVCQIYNQQVAAAVKLALLELYPAEHVVTVVRAAGVPGQEHIERRPLHEIDRASAAIDHLTTVYLPPLSVEENLRSFGGFVAIVARLRGPDGCPWDREQTHDSLKRFLVEETYETIEALDRGDLDALAEELGDLLLQIVLHAQLATEEGEFDIRDVIGSIAAKMIRRHPHVFGSGTARTAAEVLVNWDRLKEAEREGEPEGRLALAGVPPGLPALAHAEAIQKRAARAGFDWPDVFGIYAKIAEELGEVQAAGTQEGLQNEIGDLLFTLVSLTRHLGVDPDEALRLADLRFRRRFEAMERRAREMGTSLDELTAARKLELWQEAKGDDRSGRSSPHPEGWG